MTLCSRQQGSADWSARRSSDATEYQTHLNSICAWTLVCRMLCNDQRTCLEAFATPANL